MLMMRRMICLLCFFSLVWGCGEQSEPPEKSRETAVRKKIAVQPDGHGKSEKTAVQKKIASPSEKSGEASDVRAEKTETVPVHKADVSAPDTSAGGTVRKKIVFPVPPDPEIEPPRPAPDPNIDASPPPAGSETLVAKSDLKPESASPLKGVGGDVSGADTPLRPPQGGSSSVGDVSKPVTKPVPEVKDVSNAAADSKPVTKPVPEVKPESVPPLKGVGGDVSKPVTKPVPEVKDVSKPVAESKPVTKPVPEVKPESVPPLKGGGGDVSKPVTKPVAESKPVTKPVPESAPKPLAKPESTLPPDGSGGNVPAPAPTDKPVDDITVDDSAIASLIGMEVKKKADPKTEGYDPKGKVDPFAPLFKEETGAPKKEEEKKDKPKKEKKERARRTPMTPLEKVDLSQLKLVGIIRAESGNKALVEEATGKGYIVTKGTYIGINSGKVSEILRDRIIVEEEEEDLLGEIVIRKRELKMRNYGDKFYEM